MAHSDSEDEGNDDLEFETRTTDGGDGDEDGDIDEEILDALEGEVAGDDATEGDDESNSDDSDDGSDDEDDEDSEPSAEPIQELDPDVLPSVPESNAPVHPSSQGQTEPSNIAPSPRTRSLSPAQVRKKALVTPVRSGPRSYTVEAICAIPHPVPTHSLASSLCVTHLITGSEDGYIRDYDVFAAVNGKVFLTAPQRHHCGVVEGIMKAGQIRCWWENPDMTKINSMAPTIDDVAVSPVYSLAMHSDALWALAGSDTGHINLFTVRHEAGRLCHVMNGHRGPVSALSIHHDEKGFYSAGWDGEALQWDLNTGQIVRNFTAHGSQLTAIAVRPVTSPYLWNADQSLMSKPSQVETVALQPQSTSVSASGNGNTLAGSTFPRAANSENTSQETNTALTDSSQAPTQQVQDLDAKSDASFDPLFDDEPDADGEPDHDSKSASANLPASQENQLVSSLIPEHTAVPSQSRQAQPSTRGAIGSVAPPKNAPPLLDSAAYATFSADVFLTASIDGQVILWDKRVNTPGKGVGRLSMSEKTPPWCVSACWSVDGGQIYAGRRNGTVDIWDTRQLGLSGSTDSPRLLKTLRNPLSSGVVSCVVAFPDGRHIACASSDNIRLWNAAEAGEPDGSGKTKSGVQFKIIPGHHGGYVSQMIVDAGARFLVSASSNRGWHGESTRTVFVHDIKLVY